MLNPVSAVHGVAVAPHALAAQSALAVLREGGNAIEAMVCAAATIAVVYPHMNSIGGDSFWLILPPGGDPVGIDACGPSGSLASLDFYRERGVSAIPMRGPLAANTVAGTVSGWIQALQLAKSHGARLPVRRLLGDAIGYAGEGIPVTRSQHVATSVKLAELKDQPGFARTYLVDGEAPRAGSVFRQPGLHRTFTRLADEGLDSFYRGSLAEDFARSLSAVGSPVTREDLARQQASIVRPLCLQHSLGRVYNIPPPTQGLVSLLILGMLDRVARDGALARPVDLVHLTAEATKLAFDVRDRHICDPRDLTVDPQTLLDAKHLDQLAARIDSAKAAPWGKARSQPGDTIWMGVTDRNGLAVSFIQSIYHEYGSGVVAGDTGVVWQNRGASFRLDPSHLLALRPGRKPFHTLNPAGARLDDGRTLVYGTMGGDGQPQTQAAVFTRYAMLGENAQRAVSLQRWLLGRTWGNATDSLKLERRFDPALVSELRARGHEVELLEDFDEAAGHAGIIVKHPQGTLEAAADPRSDGAAAGY
jgi:gamma-glutamyltranspeptidase/glutathione hydrolase